MKRILDKSSMTEADWQQYREKQKGVGGSDAATILGLNPYKTAFTLWLEKTGQIEKPQINNEYIEWGNLLEPVIIEKFRDVTGFEVFENPYVLQHDIHEFMVANLDGEVLDPAYNGERGVLEIKTANERMKSAWQEGVPHHYMLQVQHYLAVTDYQYGYIAVLIGGNHFKYFKVERDDYVIDKLISAERDFMEMVENNISPEITSHAADSQYLADAFPDDNQEEGELSKESYAWTLRYTELQKQVKEMQDEMNYIKNRIKLEAKEYRSLKNDLIRVSMPTVEKISFDAKAFEKDYPTLYKKYKNKKTSYRNFSISLLKGE